MEVLSESHYSVTNEETETKAEKDRRTNGQAKDRRTDRKTEGQTNRPIVGVCFREDGEQGGRRSEVIPPPGAREAACQVVCTGRVATRRAGHAV